MQEKEKADRKRQGFPKDHSPLFSRIPALFIQPARVYSRQWVINMQQSIHMTVLRESWKHLLIL